MKTGSPPPGREITLFDDRGRFDTDAKTPGEGTFVYHNRSNRPYAHAIRGFYEDLFSRYPCRSSTATSTRRQFRGRFRSKDDIEHYGAAFELMCHELLLRCRFDLEVEPTIPGTPNHPDFRAEQGGNALFLLETTVAGPRREIRKAGARKDIFWTTIDLRLRKLLPEFRYLLDVQEKGEPKTSPKAGTVAGGLAQWIRGLDYDQVCERFRDGGFKATPAHAIEHAGWRVIFRVIPRPREKWARPPGQLVGVKMTDVQVGETDSLIKDAVLEKASRYGSPTIPLVIAVDVVEDYGFIDKLDIEQALFGKEQFVMELKTGRLVGPTRARDGAFWGPKGPQCRDVSAVLLAERWSPGELHHRKSILVHHPWAYRPLAPRLWPTEQWLPNRTTGRMLAITGVSPGQILGLDPSWPPTE